MLLRGALVALVLSAEVLAAGATRYVVHLDQKLQLVLGMGFEIQSDSIGSGNRGLPEDQVAVPHDLIPSERERFAREMLAGFRYCRLAGGLYWRGLDKAGRQLQPRWPEQLTELRETLQLAGVEGLSFEYWSPAPYWKANGRYVATEGAEHLNRLRCFAPGFDRDPVYRGDIDRFLADFSRAVVRDIQTLEAAGLKVSMWGLQNEPFAKGGGYSKCSYPDAAEYVRAYRSVAAAVRKHDPSIMLLSDTESDFQKKIAIGMTDPEVAALVDAYVVHTIGAPSERVRAVDSRIREMWPPRPWFQNEYKYLRGGATAERCLNTVQHIMDSFQLAGNPTWFWLHALKPYKNAEASGYSLGFWRSRGDRGPPANPEKFQRWRDGPELTDLPNRLTHLEMILPARGDPQRPGSGYTFSVNQPVTLYLLADDGAAARLVGWDRTNWSTRWSDQADQIYRKTVGKGEVLIPAHEGKKANGFGAPHAVFIEPSNPGSFSAMIGVNVPIVVRSEYLALDRAAAQMPPGSWIFNPYNWNAVGSFVKRLPWNSIALKIDEPLYDKDARIFAFQRPNGKRTIVVSNRSGADRVFQISTGLSGATWRGFRYTPDDAGEGTLGVVIGELKGAILLPTLAHLSWEFWEEQ